MNRNLRVLAVAPYCDSQDVGEAWCASQWVRNLALVADVTLLTVRRREQTSVSEQFPHVRVIEFDDAATPARFERFNSMLKPGYVSFYLRTRRWISAALAEGQRFDIAHQFTPIALRYPSPLTGFDMPYVIGPLAGSLETPAGFEMECRSAAWYTRLRALDHWRLRRDRLLKRSYAGASAVLGVAPYVGDLLSHAKPKRFEVMSELGVDDLPPLRNRRIKPGPLRLLHVGRGVRTKGLRDAIRAIALLPETLDVCLDVAGRGAEIEICKAEAEKLGVAGKVNFLGQIPRSAVEKLYMRADVFLFPSFREPSGSVVFEALRHGLPVITVDRGGPGYVVDATCGLTVAANSPEQLARDLSTAIERIANDAELRIRLGEGSRKRMQSIGLWRNKINWLVAFYGELLKQDQSIFQEVS